MLKSEGNENDTKTIKAFTPNQPIIKYVSRSGDARNLSAAPCARSDYSSHSGSLLPGRDFAHVLGDSKVGARRSTRNQTFTERRYSDHSSVLDSVACGAGQPDRGTVCATTSTTDTEPISAYKIATLQIIPNKTVDNSQVEILLRAISDLFKPRLKRFEMPDKETIVYSEDGVFWEIVYRANTVHFYLSTAMRWIDHLREKIIACWPNADVHRVERKPIPAPLDIATMHFKNHYFMSLNSSRKESSVLNGLIPVIHDLKSSDEAILQFAILPVDDAWRISALDAKNQFARGKLLSRTELNPKAITHRAGKSLDGEFAAFFELIAELVDAHPEKEAPKEHLLYSVGHDSDLQNLVLTGLSTHTQSKAQYKGFDVSIRIAAHSDDSFRRNVIIKSIATSLQCLNEDQELVLDYPSSKDKALRDLQSCKLPLYKLNKDIFSLPELARIIQLPQATLQAEHPAILSLNHRKSRLPDAIFKPNGYALGDIIEHGQSKTAYVQTQDHNVLCLPHIVPGAMGVGKTNGQGANTALGFLQNGFSAVAVDVADGKLVDTIRDSIPDGLIPEDHIIDLDFGNTSWPLPLTWSEITLKLNSNDSTMEARKAANRLSAQLIDFISRLSSHDTTDRMQRYLAAAAKAELSDPRASLLEPILMLSSDVYRTKRLPSISNARTFDTLNSLNDMQDGARSQIVQPILDRLEMLLSNEFMANCVLQRQKLDAKGLPLMNFRKWLDGDENGPYFIGIRVPKEVLLDIATDRIVSFLVSKIWLSVLSRYDTPEQDRRPAVFIMDEPHQFMSSVSLWSDMVREARKWRLKLVWLAHNIRDFKHLTKTIKDAGCQYSVYRSSKETYSDLLEELSPFTIDELMNIPDRWYAVNKIVVPDSNITVPAFLAKMSVPPKPIKDRSYRRQECSKLYGQPVELVENDIYKREQVLYQVVSKSKRTSKQK